MLSCGVEGEVERASIIITNVQNFYEEGRVHEGMTIHDEVYDCHSELMLLQ